MVDLFTIVYGSISAVFLVVILIISIKQSKLHGKKWYEVFWNLKNILLPSIDHIADTISDIGVIIEFYHASKKEWETNTALPNVTIFFVLSILVLLIYRTKSAFVVYRVSNSYIRCIMQFLFDVELYRAMYINIKFNPTESISLFKYIRQDECFYESTPQSLLSISYLIFSRGNSNPIVYFSIFFSLKSCADRFIALDGIRFKQKTNELYFGVKTFKKCQICSDFKKSMPYINRYIFRICDIISRIIMLCLIWTVISFIVFIIIFSIETTIWFGILIKSNYKQKIWLLLFSLYIHPPMFKTSGMSVWIQKYGSILQIIRNIIILGLLYIFIFVQFNCDSKQMFCANYETRYNLIINNKINLCIFIICNVFFVISSLMYILIKKFKYVLDHENDITNTIATDIWYPARAGNSIDLLANLEYGSNVNIVDERGRTALHYGLARGHTEIAKILLKYGKELSVNHQDDNEWAALHFGVRYSYKTNLNANALAVVLKEANDIDINIQNKNGETPLILASKAPFPDDVNLKSVAILLLESSKEFDLNIDVNLVDNIGNHALYYWAENGDKEMVQLLIDYGSDINKVNKNGMTAMDVAKKNNYQLIVEMLVI